MSAPSPSSRLQDSAATHRDSLPGAALPLSYESRDTNAAFKASPPCPATPTQQDTLRDATATIAHHHSAAEANAIPTISPVIPPLLQVQGRHSRTSSAGLHVQTDIRPPAALSLIKLSPLAGRFPTSETPTAAVSSLQLLSTSPGSPSYFRLHASRSAYDMANSLSPNSALPSPALSAMIDLTPLPSPMFPTDVGVGTFNIKTASRDTGGVQIRSTSMSGVPSRSNSMSTSPRKKKAYGSLMPAAVEAQAASIHAAHHGRRYSHGRNRSVSDFVPETLHNFRPRVATFGVGAFDSAEASHTNNHMHREEYLAAQRGLTPSVDPTRTLPSPPPSNTSVNECDMEEEEEADEPGAEYITIRTGPDNRKRKWRSVRQLGQGTFSKVLLATSERLPPDIAYEDRTLDPQRLVAVKICEHGPAGGADEERIKHSLDREVEILKSVSHPSIVHLKGLEEGPTRTLLVLTYCTGGDLFELASERRDILTVNLVQRMFSELVGAVRYLHENWIVHRDIKLENVLVNLPAAQLTTASLASPQTHQDPLITLTDLGLSRRIPPAPASPLLSTRCGSEDYAAPEILLGQPYDGRSTDGWALGVLLYALMEGRLPFDAPPGKPDRSRNTHRIARCDWIWCRFGDEDGEWDDTRSGAASWTGAREVVEGLLKKVRMGRKTLDVVQQLDWVKGGIKVEGGLKYAAGDDAL